MPDALGFFSGLQQIVDDATAKMTFPQRVRFEMNSEAFSDLAILGSVDLSPEATIARFERALHSAKSNLTEAKEPHP